MEWKWVWEKTKVTRISRQPSTEYIRMKEEKVDIVEYFSYLFSMTTNDARCTREIKSRITTAKAAYNKKKAFSPAKILNLGKKLIECYR
jgi:DNA-directed RNA polymerase specialized sigma54-like protein